MDSSAPLRPQNQTRKDTTSCRRASCDRLSISYSSRASQHQLSNKVLEHLRAQTTQSSGRGTENRDPNESANSTKGLRKLKGVSRLPVLAKSLHPVSTEKSQTPAYKKWEEKPVQGKAQKRKSCTKPVPFSLSQSRIRSQKSIETSENTGRFGTRSAHSARLTPAKTIISQHRTPGTTTSSFNTHAKHNNNANNSGLKDHTVAQSKYNSTVSEKTAGNPPCEKTGSPIQSDLSTHLGSITLTQSEVRKEPSHSFRTSEVDEQADLCPDTKACIQTVPSAACISAMGVSGSLLPKGVANVAQSRTPRVSTCPPGPGSSVNMPQRVSVKKVCHGAESGGAVTFSPDQSALRSILLNQGVKVGLPVGAMPRDSTCPSGRGTSIYSAQRVPLQKSQMQAAAPLTAHTNAIVSFSPDPTALRSILLNEGVKVGAGMTPRVSVCPSGRGTSIYSAQRVPVKKIQVESSTEVPRVTGGAVSFSPDPTALRSILLNKDVKVGTPAGVAPRISLCPSGRETSALRVAVKKSKADTAAVEAIQSGARRTPAFKQTPQRVPYTHSVRRLISAHKTPIFRSSPTLSTDGATQQEEDVVQRLFQEEPEQDGSKQMEEDSNELSSSQTSEHHQTVKPCLKHEGETDKILVVEPLEQLGPQSTALSLSAQTSVSQSGKDLDTGNHKMPSKLCKAKGANLSSALCALRLRRPALEELLLDDECATFTSSQQSWPALPRPSNPVASILLFQDSICFVPINLASSSLSTLRASSSSPQLQRDH